MSLLKIILSVLVFSNSSYIFAQESDEDPLDVQLGERLFLEDRFSQSFFSQFNGDYNRPLSSGDPILDEFETLTSLIAHPQKGQQVSCASCHMVDQVSQIQDNFVLTYNDLSPRSRVPWRNDGILRSTRNSMNMVLSSLKDGEPLHWDGEFYSPASLTCATLVGRNMGWLPGEENMARNHVVEIIKNDSGAYPTDSDLKGSYKSLFQQLGIEIDKITNREIVSQVCQTVEAYLKSLDFNRDERGDFSGSAYDRFLIVNGLRTQPQKGESHRDYLIYLKDQINFKKDWIWPEELPLKYHSHSSKFGPQEFQGFKAFMGRTQCASCHHPPEFTDFRFHNTGISQFEYDSVHGRGAFLRAEIPTHSQRLENPEVSFVPSEAHPQWRGNFRQSAREEHPESMDLGVWNIIAHPDKPKVQNQVKKALCESYQLNNCQWSDEEYVENSVALFKTPTLRSLGQSAPYLHNGSAKTMVDVLALYLRGSHFSKKGQMRNADPFLRAMQINPGDFRALEKFMESLDEDYD